MNRGRTIITCLVAILIVGMVTTVALADDMWVKAKNAELKDNPKGAAKTLVKIPFGAKVDAGSKKRRWRSVSYKGKKGWVYGGTLADDEPEEDPSLKAEDGSSLSSEDVDASSAVRGVGPTATKYADANAVTKQHRVFLDYHQSFVVSDRVITELPPNRELVTAKDIENFMRGGKLGPYAD